MRKTSITDCIRELGFSTLELLVVVTVGIILTAVAIPKITSFTRLYRSLGDARSVSDTVSLAKMRAAAEFTDARVYADTAKNLYRVEVWDRTQNCWVTDGDATGQCSATYVTPPSTYLSTGTTFGYGSLTSAPANTQATLGQAPACQSDSQTQSQSAGSVANSACIVFNSRGIPVDNTMTATSNDALYVTDNKSGAYGVTVLATGLIQTWRSDLGSANWINR